MKNYTDLEREFLNKNYWGLSVCIDLKNCNKNTITSSSLIKIFISSICDVIKMKRFNDPMIMHFGDDPKVSGLSFMQLIETSSITGHFANISDSAYIDIFSCKLFDPWLAEMYARQFFESNESNLIINFR